MATPTLALAAATPGAAQVGAENQLDSSQQLFAVFLGRAAAGYDSPAAPDANPVRAELLKAIGERHPASLEDLKAFFETHRQKDSAADLNQYISFALSVGTPPEFRYRYEPSELTPEVQQLAGFEKLMSHFWTDADLDGLWKQSQGAYERILEAYHSPVTHAVFETNAYLRNPTSGYLGRRFEVLVDLTGPPGVIQSRSFKDDYSVVVTPFGTTPERAREMVEEQTPEIRHSYLHYVLDPLGIKYSALIEKKKSLDDISDGAPALDEVYKRDFLLLATESLIKAVESRLAPSRERAAMVDLALREGFILTPFFADELPSYEKQQQAMRLYLPEMINAIDLNKETKRLEGVEFAKARQSARPEPAPAPKRQLSPGQQALEEAESFSFDKQYAQAKRSFQKVLENPDGGGLHARAYFGLGRVAALEKDPELAEKCFEKTLELKPDAVTESWTNLYLGRLAAASGENEQAAARYRATLAVNGGAAKAKAEAEKLLGAPAANRTP